MATPAPVTLSDAISAVEAATTALTTADGTKNLAQSKFAAAQAALTDATTAQTQDVTAYNAALDALILVATASKR